jgi:hypothetical protein
MTEDRLQGDDLEVDRSAHATVGLSSGEELDGPSAGLGLPDFTSSSNLPMCLDCGDNLVFTGDENGMYVTGKCSCVKERVLQRSSWELLEDIGNGLGQTIVIHKVFKPEGGFNTRSQHAFVEQVNAIVREVFGDYSEVDKQTLRDVCRKQILINGGVGASGKVV